MSIQLKLGKTYLNREGEKVKIIRHAESDDYPCVCHYGHGYRENGCWNYNSEPNRLDLIEEVQS